MEGGEEAQRKVVNLVSDLWVLDDGWLGVEGMGL